MGIFEDFSQFLDARLEEYIRNNPHIELQALDDKLQQQEIEIERLLAEFRTKEKQSQDRILELAEDIKRWHQRVQRATEAGRTDLAEQAREREAALLKEGNQVWAQMELAKERLAQTQKLQAQVKERRREVRRKIDALPRDKPRPEPQAATRKRFDWDTLRPPTSSTDDELEREFQRWETEDELERLKRKMGR